MGSIDVADPNASAHGDALPSMEPADLTGRAAARIRAAREAAGMSQGQLAARAGLSRPSLANIEAGRQSITLKRLAAIASALHKPCSELIA
ncbi:MAG: helix-turn-helix transcriptional regulator [Vulcanimicrobiaceae bacterium]